jgi:hypothetical protein
LNPDNLKNQILGLSTLLQLEKEARDAASEEELGFIMVNETRQLLDYQQAVLWKRHASGRVTVQTISGLSQVERNAPFVVWLQGFLKHELKSGHDSTYVLAGDEVPDRFREGWEEWTSGHVLLGPFRDRDGLLIGGLWLSRDRPWSDSETGLVDRAADAFAYAWSGLASHGKRGWSSLLASLGTHKVRMLLLLLFVGAMFLPVRQSVLAPSEVVARGPMLVSAPVEGVVKQFHIEPNAQVKAGDLLFSLDDTVLRNRHEIAKKVLDVARADYLRASQKAFSDEQSKANMALLRAEMEQKSAEVTYTAELLERINVRAVRDGTAVFNDPNDWLGKPLETGEKVLSLAAPLDTELKIWLPVEDAINLEPGAQVRVFLNINPTTPVSAELKQTSYEAQVTPAGVLAFPLRAFFVDEFKRPRLGLKGTAKIYGEKVTLFYYLMRRPIAALRRVSGL